ncbi:hypothetical protein V6N11_059564 [Hibiscus sabdariffa]|uniref:Uncharacterized protein n=1 Tax=Hibiscus sabdariffa TaxID=183260 RepID=A0ABR2NP35_9ROSI
MANPNGNPTKNPMSVVYGEPPDGNGGRPSDPVAHLSAFPTLERHASPLEDAQNPKKQCNEVVSEGVFPGGRLLLWKRNLHFRSTPGGDPGQQSDKHATPIGPSVDQPYGPWMVADNSRCKPQHGNRSTVVVEPVMGVQGASRFPVLEEMQVKNGMAGGANVMVRPRPVIQGVERKNGVVVGQNMIAPKEFPSNVAYLESNPGKKKKNNASREVVEVNVVPSSEDLSPKMIVRSVEHVRGDHTAVAIKENSLHGKGSARVRMTRGASTSGGVSDDSDRIMNYLVKSSKDEDAMDDSDGVADCEEDLQDSAL